MAREVFYVVVHGDRWAVKHNGVNVSTHNTQAEALEAARARAKALWEIHKKPSQVVVQGKDGKFREERTYGNDPVKYPG